ANATTISNPPVAAAATLPLNNGCTANWTAPTGNGPAAFTYTLEYSTDNTFATGVTSVTAIASGTLASAVTGLSPLTIYYYRVKVVNAGGSSTYSTLITVTTLGMDSDHDGIPNAIEGTGDADGDGIPNYL